MARVTIEDCLEKVDDRFELVALSAQRARNISSGAALTIERKGEKDTVISLREIAEGTVEIGILKADLLKSFQKEKDRLEEFVAPANNNDSIEIDAEEAEIAAAIAEASEKGVDQGEDLGEGFSVGEQIFASENLDTKD
jgi:DNA-directed RNA polymerase subunit omega